MKVIVSGGGTGGHIYPAIAIANEFKKKYNAEVLFVGAKYGMEKDISEGHGIRFEGVSTAGFSGRNILKRIRSFVKTLIGVFQSFSIVMSFKPDYVIGTGGYASAPILFASGLMGKKCYIQEQNAFPGKANLFLSRFCKVVFTSFEESKSYFGKNREVYNSGNPIRADFYKMLEEGRGEENALDLKDGGPLKMVIVGGSGGAQVINELAVDLMKTFNNSDKIDIKLITGKARYDVLIRDINEMGFIPGGNIHIVPYENNMPALLQKTDIIISRAGATTLSELIELGLPGILIPSPNVKDNHQEYNARVLEKAGLAMVYIEKDMVYKNIEDKISRLIKDRSSLAKMKESAVKLRLSKPAAQFIVEKIVEEK